MDQSLTVNLKLYSMKFLNTVIYRCPINSYNTEINNELFKEALYLSSFDLFKEYKKDNKNENKPLKEYQKLKVSLHKYQVRACTRCTPFGLFAGVGDATWGTTNNILLSSNNHNRLSRKTRLDMNIVCSLAQELSKKEFIRPHLKFYVNNSLYKTNNTYRYIEYHYINDKRVHSITKVDSTEYLDKIIQATTTGKHVNQLVSLLTSGSISEEDATSFISELIDSQILTSELEPTVTGKDFYDNIIEITQNINSIFPTTELCHVFTTLISIKNRINQIDLEFENTNKNEFLYSSIYDDLKNILPGIKEHNLFQTDLFISSLNATIDHTTQEQINKSVQFVNKITPKVKNKNLEDFKNRFVARYEDKEINLLNALDTETGLGYLNKDTNVSSPLVDDLQISLKKNETDLKWNELQKKLQNIILKSIKNNQKTVTVTDEDFEGIDYSTDFLPLSMAAVFKVIDSQKNKIKLNTIGGSSATNLLGRFAYGNNAIQKIIDEIVDHETRLIGDKTFAEIVHLPESRTGNILSRPSIRKHEIAYLAKSSVNKEEQIDISDITLSIKNNTIILKSSKTNKEIIPRLGNAHNYTHNSLPVYHFLCDLQTQYFEKSSIGFSWGSIEQLYDFFPRIEYQNTVLSPARWIIEKSSYEGLLDKKKSWVEIANLFSKLNSKWELPDKFLLVDGDNELLINTKQETSLMTFIDILKSRASIKLEEFLHNTDSPLIKDSEGNGFTNECIAIILNNNSLTNNPTQKSNYDAGKYLSPKQEFSLGSEWLYYKIYCGVKTADSILTEKILPLTENLMEKNAIDSWFFIRYNDPDNHLRFRLHIKDFSQYGDIIQKVNQEFEKLIHENIIFKLQTDTYVRELDRYGKSTIEISEHIFHHDSNCTANALNLLDPSNGNEYRWHYALRSTDALLNDFGLSTIEKSTLLSQLSTSFFEEHGGQKELKIQLDTKYRDLRNIVDEILNKKTDTEKEIQPLIELLNLRSKKMKPYINSILIKKNNYDLYINYNHIISSFLHMMLNRIFIAKNRMNEFVIYDLLARHYKSILAKEKNNAKKIEKIA